MTNIISLADIAKKYRVTMDTYKEKAINVHLPNKIVKFPQLKGGLYARKPQSEDRNYQFTNILKNLPYHENAYVTPNKMRRAIKARNMLHALGVPTSNKLKKLISMNQI